MPDKLMTAIECLMLGGLANVLLLELMWICLPTLIGAIKHRDGCKKVVSLFVRAIVTLTLFLLASIGTYWALKQGYPETINVVKHKIHKCGEYGISCIWKSLND